jgi:antitoxin ParD1/3/4
MAHNTSVSLGAHFQQFSAELVEEGRYNSVSDVVRAGMRLLEEHEHRLKALQQALREGEASGYAEDFDPEAFRQRMRAKHGAKA